MSPFQQHAQLFYYKSANGLVQIDITPDWQVCLGHDYPLQTAFILIAFSSPYIPPKAIPIANASTTSLPYMSAGPITLTQGQKQAVLEGLEDVVRHSKTGESWWVNNLSL